MSDKQNGDLAINLEYQLFSGHLIGRSQPTSMPAGTEADIARNIHSAIASSFQKFPQELAETIEQAISRSDPEAAAAAVTKGLQDGIFGFAPTPALLSALLRVDVSAVVPTARKTVRECRMFVAQMLGRHPIVGDEADALLIEFGAEYTTEQKSDLEMAVAIANAQEGQVEAALATWHRLLETPGALSSEGRAWAWRNISLSLDRRSTEARAAAQHSADAFLESGNKEQAATSLMQVVDSLMGVDPQQAIQTLDEILAVVSQKSMRSDELRAAALHARAMRLMDLAQWQTALADAEQAVALRRGLLGAEAGLVSSLHLASILLDKLGRQMEAVERSDEADRLTQVARLSHFELSQRVTQLAKRFDVNVAASILADAEQAGNNEIVAAVMAIRALLDESTSNEAKLSFLETTLTTLNQRNAREDAKLLVWQALAVLLTKMNKIDRAIPWFERILEADPWDNNARDNLINAFWQRREWDRAVALLRAQIALRGELPGLLFALGKSLLGAGKLSEAIPELTKSIQAAPENSVVKSQALTLREEALSRGGTVNPVSREVEESPIDRAEFDGVLRDFSTYISGDKRMRFWQREDAGADYAWIERPERLAQDLLHTFLRARFGKRILVFEEITAGAGRLDIFARLSGQLALIIELKMCGFGYSSVYAASGEDQILHYMQNRDVHLGYLVVFDARLDENGQRLVGVKPADNNSVFEVSVDVRPRLSKRSGKA